eukprot:12932490-Prorocentrum_lima.AAC.1
MLATTPNDGGTRTTVTTSQAEIYVDAEALFRMGEGRLFAASFGVTLYDGIVPWQSFSGVRWRFNKGDYRALYTEKWQ